MAEAEQDALVKTCLNLEKGMKDPCRHRKSLEKEYDKEIIEVVGGKKTARLWNVSSKQNWRVAHDSNCQQSNTRAELVRGAQRKVGIQMECSCRRKAAVANNHSTELVQRMDELREKRDELKKLLQVEEQEKASIQKDMVVLTKRLAEIDDSLSRKYAYSSEYDKTIQEVEAAYAKILESSQALLRVLKTGAIQIPNKRISPSRDFSQRHKRMSVPNELPY